MLRGDRVRIFISGLLVSFSLSIINLKAENTDVISEIMLDVEAVFQQLSMRDERIRRDYFAGMSLNNLQLQSDEFDKYFPDRPINRPLVPGGSSPYPGFIPSHGMPYLIAIKVLYDTLMYFGVDHYFGREGNTIDFVVISSSEGYFKTLDSSTVAFALREFSRYLSAHLCGDPSIINYHKMRGQVPIEEIGLRFKYDMAWALLGNYLPKEPNGVYELGQKWGTFGQLINSQRSLPQEQTSELRRYGQMITDAINFMGALNKSHCFVDISVKAREEIIKRVSVKDILKLERSLHEIYDEKYEIIRALREAEKAQQEKILKSPS